MRNLVEQVVDYSRLTPQIQGRSIDFRLDVHNPGLFSDARERTRISNGVAGMPYAETALRGEQIEWCMIASTGHVVIWSAAHVLAYGSIEGVSMENQFLVSREPPCGEMARFWDGYDYWFDFYLDSAAHRLRSPTNRRTGALMPSDEVIKVSRHSVEPWLGSESVEWMGISEMGSVLFYTASCVGYLWAHFHVERLIILSRHPPVTGEERKGV